MPTFIAGSISELYPARRAAETQTGPAKILTFAL